LDGAKLERYAVAPNVDVKAAYGWYRGAESRVDSLDDCHDFLKHLFVGHVYRRNNFDADVFVWDIISLYMPWEIERSIRHDVPDFIHARLKPLRVRARL
jgi:hypothetical protein